MQSMITVGNKLITEAAFYGVLAITYLYGTKENYHFSPEQAEEISFIASELKRGMLVHKVAMIPGDLHLPALGLSANYISTTISDVRNMLLTYHQHAESNPDYKSNDAYTYIRGAVLKTDSDEYQLPDWLVAWYVY